RMGIGWVQDDRGIFGTLSVLENLVLPPVVSDESWSLDKIFSVFPILKERAAQSGSKLSGGEQQMLAIARVLRMGARILLLDEPTEGLAPLLVQRVSEIIKEIKSHGLTVLLVEQNLRFATTVADTHHLSSTGGRCGASPTRTSFGKSGNCWNTSACETGRIRAPGVRTTVGGEGMQRGGAVICAILIVLGPMWPAAGQGTVQLTHGKVVLAVINDQSGVYADIGGKHGVEAVKMAVEDFVKKYGPNAVGGPIEVLSADHQNKPDVGASKAAEFYDRNNANAVIDVPTSSVGIA